MWFEKIFSLDLTLVPECCSPLALIFQRCAHIVMAISVLTISADLQYLTINSNVPNNKIMFAV